jgi:hypothetical protein
MIRTKLNSVEKIWTIFAYCRYMEFTIIKKIPLQNFCDAQHHMLVRHCFYHVLEKRFTKLHCTLLMTG